MSLMEKLMDQKINDSIDSETIDDDAPPPDNGAWYICCCNWGGSMYQRFDRPFITFFAVMAINAGMWIIAKLAV